MKHNSTSYVRTVVPSNVEDMQWLSEFKEFHRQRNKFNKTVGSPLLQRRVCVKGRWGKNNPAIVGRRALTRPYQTCPLNYAVRWDVYLYVRSWL